MTDAEQIIRDLLRSIAAEQNFNSYDLKLTPITTSGANYTSHLFTATLSDGQKELNIFAKLAAIGEKMRAQFPMKLYDIERLFYTKLAKAYCQLEEKNGIPTEHRLKFPQIYGYSDKLYEETIVLENLAAKGYNSFDRFQSVKWDYAESAITQMAKLHALSVAYQIEDPEVRKKLTVELKFEMPGEEEETKKVWDKILNQAIDATKEENKEKLKKFFEKNKISRESYMKLNEAVKVAVIMHGDYRPSNLMHRIREDGSLEVIPVDYQTIRAGSPVIDLLYFIFTGTDAEFRENYYEKLIEHYYSELRASLTRLGLNPDEKYSKDDFEFELKEKLHFGLSIAVFTLPIVTVEAENAPKVDAEMELSDFSIQKTGSLYPERLNGVVDDFVRWGVI